MDQPGSTRPVNDHPLYDAPNTAFPILPDGWPRYRPGQEVHEETGLAITEITHYLGTFDYTSGSGKRTRQHTWTVTTAPDEIRLTEHDDFAWTMPDDNYAVSTEVQELIDTHRNVASDRA